MSEASTRIDIRDDKASAERKRAGAGGAADSREYVHCPCCGSPTLLKPVEVKGDMLEQFLAATISGEPFKHAYGLFAGRITVVVQSVPRDMSMTLSSGARALHELESKAGGKGDGDMVKATINAMRIYAAVESISVNASGARRGESYPCDTVRSLCERLSALDMSAMEPDSAAEAIRETYETMISPDSISGVPFNTVIQLVETHNNLYGILLESGFDSNFWKGIELV